MVDLLEAKPPADVNTKLLNAILRRQVVLANAEDEVVKRLARIYKQAAREVAGRITDAAARGLGPERFSQELRSIRAGEIRAVAMRLQSQVAEEFDDALNAIWDAELQTGVKIFNTALPDDVLANVNFVRPNFTQIDSANVRVLGQSLGRWGQRAADYLVDELARELAVGIVRGDDMRAMIARTADVFGVSRRRATETARTAVMTVSNEAHSRLYEANQDIVAGVVYTATFDRRTCPVCAGYHGGEYRFADGSYASRPRTPVHMQCRCLYVPITKSWRELGLNIDDVPVGTRASMNGQVPGAMNFGQWLKTQPRSVADDVLGRTRADLFLKGKLSLKSFVNERTSKPIPLSKLKQRLERASN